MTLLSPEWVFTIELPRSWDSECEERCEEVSSEALEGRE